MRLGYSLKIANIADQLEVGNPENDN